jgi:hypothetical protein
VINSRGGSPRIVPETVGGFRPAWSPKGEWIYFACRRPGGLNICKVGVAGGGIEQITRSGAYEGLPSPDGSIVYFTKPVPGASFAIWSVPAGGGPETPVPELQKFDRITRSWGVLREGIHFLARDEPSRPVVRFFNLSTRQVTPLFPLEKETMWEVPDVDLSQDGRYALVVQLDHRINDLVMIDNFR